MGGQPLALALALAAAAMASLALTVLTSVRRRRRELALLKTLGMTRHQLRGRQAATGARSSGPRRPLRHQQMAGAWRM
jgi:hypothetical protein